MAYNILIVDDDLKNIKATRGFLRSNGYYVETVQTVEEALVTLEKTEFALVLLDYQMPDMMGDTAAALILQKFPQQQIAMFSCDLSRDAVKQSLKSDRLFLMDIITNPDGSGIPLVPPLGKNTEMILTKKCPMVGGGYFDGC